MLMIVWILIRNAMRKKHEDNNVILLTDSEDEYRSAILNLNRDKIPYKSFVRTMIVLTRANWLLSNIDSNAK